MKSKYLLWLNMILIVIMISFQLYINNQNEKDKKTIIERINKIENITKKEKTIYKTKNAIIKDLDRRLNNLEKIKIGLNDLKKRANLELSVSKALHQISESNLTAPNFIIGIIISGFAIIGGLAVFAVRHITINKLNNMDKRIFKMDSDRYKLLATVYSQSSVEEWKKKNYNEAVEKGEKAVEYAKEFLRMNPDDAVEINLLKRYKSNLAFYYTDDKRNTKKGIAIEYAKEGLDYGKYIDEIQYIDNYIYTVKYYDDIGEEKETWIKVFTQYKGRLKEILHEKEFKEYEDYFNKFNEVNNN